MKSSGLIIGMMPVFWQSLPCACAAPPGAGCLRGLRERQPMWGKLYAGGTSCTVTCISRSHASAKPAALYHEFPSPRPPILAMNSLHIGR